MVEINNQRKAFLDSYVVGGNWITDAVKPEIMVMTSLWRIAIYRLLRSPRKLVTLNSKTQPTGAGRYQLLFLVGGMPTVKQLGLKDFSEKSGRCGIAAD